MQKQINHKLKMQLIKEAGKTASSLTRKTQEALKNEIKDLLKKYALEELKSKVKNGVYSSVLSVIGLKCGEALFKETLNILLPIYKEADEETILNYFEEYFGDIYKNLTTECDQ